MNSMKLPSFSSMSAPKKIGTRDKPIFDFSVKNISPGISPSVYAIPNFAVETNKDIFFNSSIPISDLKNLGDVDTILEEDLSPKSPLSGLQKYEMWISKSTSGIPTDPVEFHKNIELLKNSQIVKGEQLFAKSKPPGFEKSWGKYTPEEPSPDPSKPLDSKDSQSDRNMNLSPNLTGQTDKYALKSSRTKLVSPNVFNSEVLLQQPPKIGLVKREIRGKFNEEEVSYERYTGKIKFYQLKKRFGFISLDEDRSDVFLCEDDLILSGISYKKFKEDIFNKSGLRLEFNIKKYLEGDKEKRKAINIAIFKGDLTDKLPN